MDSISSILVVVDPTVERDFVIDRAKTIARVAGTKIRFFINSSNTLTQHSYAYEGMDGHFFEQQRLLFVDHYNQLLATLVKEFSEEAIDASSAFSEEHNLAEAVIAHVKEFEPGLVMKSTHHHGFLKKSLISNTDWRLIRKCPKPLLLVKPKEWFDNGSLVAAVDPLHAKAGHTKLDHLIVEVAEQAGEQFKLDVRVFHSYFPFVGSMFPTAAESSEQIEELRMRHQNSLNVLLVDHNVPAENVEMARGDLVPSLVKYLEKVNANILVLGVLSKNVLERAIVGNTAEKILDDCPCDVLVIKARKV
jgi:universal stress protein E